MPVLIVLQRILESLLTASFAQKPPNTAASCAPLITAAMQALKILRNYTSTLVPKTCPCFRVPLSLECLAIGDGRPGIDNGDSRIPTVLQHMNAGRTQSLLNSFSGLRIRSVALIPNL